MSVPDGRASGRVAPKKVTRRYLTTLVDRIVAARVEGKFDRYLELRLEFEEALDRLSHESWLEGRERD